MAKHDKQFDANARLRKSVDAFAFVALRAKGFLGPDLGSDNRYPSVGVSAARRSGVIVDDAGKMRCPPGTPNANQFTDINMSNCMVPSAETVARQAAEVAADAAKKIGGGFKRGEFGSRTDITPVDMGIGTSGADGKISTRRVAIGAQVVMPETGESTTLDNIEKSTEFVRQGGSLSDVPDEHVISAIEGNSVNGGRFTLIRNGGGVNGMSQYQDSRNGRLFGVKYFKGHGVMRQDHDEEQLNELVGEVFAETLGFEPTPMRLVPSKSTADGQGVSLITELAFNRHGDDIAHHDTEFDINDTNMQSLVAMRLLDEAMGNSDRHEGNYLVGTDADGKSTFIPIDHSLIADPSLSDSSIGVKDTYFINPKIERLLGQIEDDPEIKEELIKTVSELQDSLMTVNLDELESRVAEMIDHVALSTRNGSFDKDAHMKRYRKVIERIKMIQAMDPADLAEVIIADKYGTRRKAPIPSWGGFGTDTSGVM